MAHEVRHNVDIKQPSSNFSRTPEQTYWQTFKSPLQIPSPSNHAVTHISQPPSNHSQSGLHCDFFAVTTGSRIQLYSHRTRKLLKTITRFDDTAHSGEVRYDGRVLVAGDETGSIQVFDTNSRAILKTWKEHRQPVWVTRWHPTEPTTLLSGSDDNTLRLWDLPSENSTTIFRGHLDYIRAGAFLPSQTSPHILSGSYDRTVRLWDSRIPTKSVMTFAHTSPVECLLPSPTGQQVLASASNQIAILDLVAAKSLHLITNHQKTVTSLCFASNYTRIVSGALDGHMKVFETNAYNVVSGSKYPSPILSLAIIASGQERSDKHVAVGLQSGILSIRTRLSGPDKAKDRARRAEMDALIAGTLSDYDKSVARKKKRGRGWEIRLRGRDYNGEDADMVIDGNERKKRKKPKEWQKLLHAGRYRESLDALLSRKEKSSGTVLSLLITLRHRSALRAALEERDEVSLQPILSWVHQQIAYPDYVPVCVEVGMNILDLYSKYLGESGPLEEGVTKLHERVREEVERSQVASMTRGMLGLLAPPGREAGFRGN